MSQRKTDMKNKSEPFEKMTVKQIWIIILPALCMVSSLMLVMSHLGSFALFGCGDQTPCAQLAAGKWGKIPGIQWPVSFLGFSYFLSVMGVCIVDRCRLPRIFIFLIRTGVMTSILFTGIMLVEKILCPYCLFFHLINITFWILLETSHSPAPLRYRPIMVFFTLFIGSSLILGVMNANKKAAVSTAAERELGKSREQIMAASDDNPEKQPRSLSPSGGFTGRYRMGPEQAPVRLVVFSDYQCPDCYRIEKEIQSVAARYKNISISAKQYPMSSDCNPRYTTRNPHPNACWAARAAEAAGILQGTDGFWRMHEWLFERKGLFTDEQLRLGLEQLGFEYDAFIRAMTSEETLRRVRNDIDEAIALGLNYTPMVYVNGMELRGLNAENALTRTMEALLAANLPIASAASDHPPLALQKYVEDWANEPPVQLPEDPAAWILGPRDAPHEIILFSDYQESFTAQADQMIREILSRNSHVKYSFYHYPVDAKCNPSVKSENHPLACLAAKYAETAGKLAGQDGFWRMHQWLMSHQAALSVETLQQAVLELGFDPTRFDQSLTSSEIEAAVTQDIQTANALKLRAIPLIIIDRRIVPRAYLDGRYIIPEIMDYAMNKRH